MPSIIVLMVGSLVYAVAAAAQAVTGFGFALLAVPLVAGLVDAKTAVVATGVLGATLMMRLLVHDHAHVERRTVTVMVLAGLAGMPLGIWVLTNVDDRSLTVTIAAVVLSFTAALAMGLRLPPAPAIEGVAGFVSGALATSTGTNGPPIVIALAGRRLAPHTFRATLGTVFLLQGVVALGAFALAGEVTAEVGWVAAAGLPGLVVGWSLGNRLFARMGQERFRRIVLVMLILSALVSLASALVG